MSIPDNPDPVALFAEWYTEWTAKANIVEPNAVTLVTVDEEGQPWPRVVLLKGFDTRGFTFFTNTRSNKGKQLAANPRAAMNFYWPTVDKQVRVLGSVSIVTPEEADAYFASRARTSQIGAWASHQSEPLASREELESRCRELERKYEGADVPRPPHWSGYRIRPHLIEFWLAAPFRLHHRREYRRTDTGWRQHALNP